MRQPLKDGHGRPIGDVRISVTDRCNFRCQYCMPAEGLPWLDRDALLTYEEIARLVRVLSEMGVHDVRLTGGEPRYLLVGEQRVAVEPGQALGRHAVLAAEVAAVGDRDAHVADRPAVPVDERLGHARWKSDFPPVLSSSSTRSITTPGSIPLTMS